jgi:excisionase family DNA binding protein
MQKHTTESSTITAVAPAPQPAFLTISEAAAEISATRRFLEQKISDGELKVFRPSRRLVRISRAEFDRWIEEFSTKGGAL